MRPKVDPEQGPFKLFLLFVYGFSFCGSSLEESSAPSRNKRAYSAMIIGGRPSSAAAHPWVVSFQYKLGNGWRHACGGTLISPSWVVTAAHCVPNHSYYLYYLRWRSRVVLGTTNLDVFDPGAQAIGVSVSFAKYSHDILLLKLKVPAIVNNVTVRTIRLAESSNAFVYSRCQLAGWGKTNFYGQTSNSLRMGDMTVLDRQFCEMYWGWLYDHEICATNYPQSTSACDGDSGSSLVCRRKVDGQNVLLGFASYVYGKCSNMKPNLFTTVPYFIDWISQITGIAKDQL